MNVGDGTAAIARWWSKKYGLPASDPSFQNARQGELLLEFYEDLWIEKKQLDTFEEKEGKLEKVDRARLKQVNAALGIAEYASDDPLIDKWEREIREGRTPNLDETMDG